MTLESLATLISKSSKSVDQKFAALAEDIGHIDLRIDKLDAKIDRVETNLSAKIDAHVQGANRLKFTPDGKQVFISSLGTGDLIIYDALSQKEVKRLKIGHGAAGILMDPVANRAFVACSADNNIVVVDLKTLEVTGRFDVGGVPDGLAWAEQQ